MDRSAYPYILPLIGFAVYLIVFLAEGSDSFGESIFGLVLFGPFFFSIFLWAALIVVPILMTAFVVQRKYVAIVITLHLTLYTVSYYWALNTQFLGSDRKTIFAIFALVVIGNSYAALLSNSRSERL
jgi:hypothetical protein